MFRIHPVLYVAASNLLSGSLPWRSGAEFVQVRSLTCFPARFPVPHVLSHSVQSPHLLTAVLHTLPCQLLTAVLYVAASNLLSRSFAVLTLGIWGWICTGSLPNLFSSTFPSSTRLVTLGPVSPLTPFSINGCFGF